MTPDDDNETRDVGTVFGLSIAVGIIVVAAIVCGAWLWETLP